MKKKYFCYPAYEKSFYKVYHSFLKIIPKFSFQSKIEYGKKGY